MLFFEGCLLLKVFSFFIVCLTAAYTDIIRRRVSNRIIVSGFIIGAISLLSMPTDPVFAENWTSALGAALVCFLAFLPLYMFRAMGAADVKFFSLLGFWFASAAPMLFVFVVASLMLAAHTVIQALSAQWPGVPLIWVKRRVAKPSLEAAPVRIRNGQPYAAYMAFAALIWVVMNA
ncbi:MAG: A24 family peptidase [Pigmentiphaga sp.]|nr:A24 family peptidase [Pigmentiphaga sp.]